MTARLVRRSVRLLACLAPIFGLGCDDTRLDPLRCYTHPCGAGYVCTADFRCVPALDGGAPDGAASHDGTGLDGAAGGPAYDGATIADVSLIDSAKADAPAGLAVEVALDGASPVLDAMPSPMLDAEIDATAAAPQDVAIDMYAPDAAGTCAIDRDCSAPTPYCLDNRCVACRTSAECQGGTPICSAAHACVSCAQAPASCPASAPVCEPSSGRCVECVANADCKAPTQPICDGASHACVPCTRDEQCAGGGPAVCLYHLDGRCATDAETVYVVSSQTAACSDTAAAAGSALVPYCTVQKGVLAAKAKGKSLVVLAGELAGGFLGVALTEPLTVVGKEAVITPEDFSDGIGITSGDLYLRGLTVAGNANRQTGVGVNAQATAGATLALHIDGCVIRSNPGGGILLAGAAFDIQNTVVTGNGPGQTSGGTSFGGVRVDSLAAAGPARLNLVTITDNLAPGLSCAAGVQGTGVLVTGNSAMDVANSCGITACTVPGPTCGAQL
ncbi:MAG: hypothetical protein JXP73_02090 [Deltaproteobacteria bacterium]|nr:hypothetical protein [Deltaproteobacteria bacterium]